MRRVSTGPVNFFLNSDPRWGVSAICEDRYYRLHLELREMRKRECGHANWMRCTFCQEYDAPENLYVRPDRSQAWHRGCREAQR